MTWLYEARKRYGLSVLNYIVTSNHVHLIARDNGGRDTIPKSIQLIAGRKVINRSEGYELREPAAPYNLHFDPKNVVLRPENAYCWRN